MAIKMNLSQKLEKILMSGGVLDVKKILYVRGIKGEALHWRATLAIKMNSCEYSHKPIGCQGVVCGGRCGVEKTKPLDGHLCPIGERPGSPLNVQKPLKNGGKIPEIPLLSLTTMPMFLEKRGNPWN